MAHGLTPAETHTQYIFLLAESVQSIIVAVHASVIISALAGALLGGLGGALSSLLPHPVKPAPQAGLAVHIMALAAASFSLTQVVTVYPVLKQVTQNAVVELELPLPYSTSTIFDFPLAVALLWWLFWLWMSWRTFKFAPTSQRCAGFSTLGLSLLGWMAVLPLILLGDRQFVVNLLVNSSCGMVVFLLPLILLQTQQWSKYPGWLVGVLGVVGYLLVIALILGLAALIRRRLPGRVRQFFQRWSEAHLMAWIVLGITLLTGLLIILLSDPALWRKPLFSGGMVAGLGLALLGVRAARAVQPTEEPVLKVGDILTTSGLGTLCANMAVAVTSLAPIALTQFPIGTLTYLLPEPAPPVGGFSDVQQMAKSFMENTLLLTGSLVVVLPLLAGLMSVLLWGLWRRVTRR